MACRTIIAWVAVAALLLLWTLFAIPKLQPGLPRWTCIAYRSWRNPVTGRQERYDVPQPCPGANQVRAPVGLDDRLRHNGPDPRNGPPPSRPNPARPRLALRRPVFHRTSTDSPDPKPTAA